MAGIQPIILAESDCFHWNESSQPWLFIESYLKDTDVPHGSLINKNLVGWGGDGQGSLPFCFSGDTKLQPSLRTTALEFHFTETQQSFSVP